MIEYAETVPATLSEIRRMRSAYLMLRSITNDLGGGGGRLFGTMTVYLYACDVL
jgi:hypothetical protein